jgi:plasmid stability protein
MKDIHIRFPTEELHRAIKKSAANNHRSLNNEIVYAIELYLKEIDEAKPVEKEEAKKKPKSPQT